MTATASAGFIPNRVESLASDYAAIGFNVTLPFLNGGEHFDYDWLEIPIWLSLTVIVGTLAVTAVLSLMKSGGLTQLQRDAATGPRRDWEDDD